MSWLTIADIEQLADNCRKQESKLLIGNCQLSINLQLIEFINHSNNSRHNCIVYMRQLLEKCANIKLIKDNRNESIGNNSTINLSRFLSCVSLELNGVLFKRLIGLESIRSQLKSLSCIKTFETKELNELFWDLFGVWPSLTSLKLSHNNIESVMASVIPSSVQTLDLSWNRISHFNNINNYSVNSVTNLDLSYNTLTVFPQLNNLTCATLKWLDIRSNLIESVSGIENLCSLFYLDIRYNCIIDVNSFIECLRHCNSLRQLFVKENPFCSDRNVNSFIKTQLSHLTHLDGIKLDKTDTIERSNENGANSDLFSKSIKKELTHNESETNLPISEANIVAKRKKLRYVKILDSNDVIEDIDSLSIKDNDDSEYEQSLTEKTVMLKQKRQELGPEWLVSMNLNNDNLSLPPESDLNQNLNQNSEKSLDELNDNIGWFSVHSTRDETSESDNQTQSRTNLIDDDIEVLPKGSNEESQWISNDLENDSNIFIVECSEKTIFISIRPEEGLIYEKDCITGKILRTHDLKVVVNAVIENSMLKLQFDTQVISKREINYQFESNEICNMFKSNFINSWILKRQLNYNESQYECLKCNFTKSSDISITICPQCKSDVIMLSDDRKRRSGSDITILTQTNHNQIVYSPEPKNEILEQIISNQTDYDYANFTKIDHRLKLYIEVDLFVDPNDGNNDCNEVVEAVLKCKSIIKFPNKLQSSLLVISNKKLYICSYPESEIDLYDNIAQNVKIYLSRPLSSLKQIKDLPKHIKNQGFWLEWNDINETNINSSKQKLFIRKYGFGSKKPNLTDLYDYNTLIIIGDEIICSSFIDYFRETVINIMPIPNMYDIVFDEKFTDSQNDILKIHFIDSAKYKRNDMKIDILLNDINVLIVTKQYIYFGQIFINSNEDYNVKILHKELITNLFPPVYINIESKMLKILFYDDIIETHFTFSLSFVESMKKVIEPIKTIWEKLFAIPLTSVSF